MSSDMHHLRHADAFKDALRTTYIEKLMFDYPLKNKMLLAPPKSSPEGRT